MRRAVGCTISEQKANMLKSLVMARRPDCGTEKDEMWGRVELKEIGRKLSFLNSHTFPHARAIQELVQAWKQLRKWR